jgi:hypothetical protein
MIKALNITSDIKPAGGGLLPQRISIHRSEGAMPIVTHHEALKEGGNWCRFGGNYFSAEDLPAALADYQERCRQLGVVPFPKEDA